MQGKKVLVVEDSTFMCQLLNVILSGNNFAVEFARNGREAIEKVKAFKPDVITMDIEMPVMSGLDALAVIMDEKPVPVIMVSALTLRGAEISLRALEMGAFDVVTKPGNEIGQDVESFQQELITKINIALLVPPEKLIKPKIRTVPASTVYSTLNPMRQPEPPVIVIGASTGGPTALHTVLSQLPGNFPAPILIVQHMPQNFTKLMAERLDSICQLQVKEAENGDSVVSGKVLIAPGGMQMVVAAAGPRVVTRIHTESPISTPYKPSINVLFRSVAEVYGKRAIGLMLTGMGSDGLEGCGLLKEKGATVVAESEKTCIVYGMSKCVIEAGLADKVLPLPAIGEFLVQKLYGGEEERRR